MSEDKDPPSKRQKTDANDKTTEEEATEDFTEDVSKEDERFTEDDDKCKDFVSPEELERLREFKILDEVKSNDEDSNEEESDSSDGVPEEEIEKMLEENLPEDYKEAPKLKEKPYITRQKSVLEEKGVNHFEVLPLDWMMVRHYSGMPIYMHRTTRVCTLSKPYFLGKGNTRRHDIPISAIPCLAYRKALEEEEKQKEIDRQMEEQIRNGTWQQLLNKSNKDNSECNTTNKTDNKNVQESAKDKLKCPFNHTKTSGSINQHNSEVLSNENGKESIKNQDYVESKLSGVDLIDQKCEELTECLKMDIELVKNDIINSEEKFITENDDKDVVQQIIDENAIDKVDINSKEYKTDDATDDQKNTKESVDEENHKDIIDGEKDNGNATEERQEISEDSKTQEIPLNRQPVILPGGIVMPPPRVETVSTSWKTQHLTHEQINDYCKRLFKFKTVKIMHFKRWADRRKYTKARKTLQYPTLPEGTKLITIPAQVTAGQENGGKANKRDWVMNMNGRSYLSVFHEYVFRALQKQPTYEFKQLENAATPYQATVYIGGMQYGVGHGSSKRSAKAAAARASIHILIPEMREQIEPTPAEPDFSFFDYVGIEDPRITEFCAATCEPAPHAILRTCLLRNFGAGDKHIQTQMKKLEYQKIELTMTVGKHTATVVCKNKKTAKQRASQAILQALHPHVRSWGSLLRLYGSRSVKSCKEKKLEEQQITLLQDAARAHQPNHAVLAKLRQEMRKLAQRDTAVVPLGTLRLDHALPTHSASNLNNVDL